MRWPPAFTRALASILAVAVVSACSLIPPTITGALQEPSEEPAVSLPETPFAPLSGRGTGVTAEVNALMARDSIVVAVGSYEGNVTKPLFRWSPNAGATWYEGQLSWVGESVAGVADSSLGLAAFSGGTWVALGKAGDRLIAWTSKNGQTWDRSITTGLTGANLYSMSAAAGGLVLVGSALGADGVHQVPCAWRSNDGIAWHKVPVSTAPGQLNDVTRRGDALVAVGEQSLDAPSSTGLVQQPVSFVSVDGGRKWRPSTPPEPAKSDHFASSLTHVVATSTAFVAAGTYSLGGVFRTFAVSSKDGIKWTPLPSADAGAPRSWVRDLMVVANQPMMLTGVRDTSGATTEIHLYRYDGAKKWLRTDLPDKLNQAETRAALGVGSTALVSLTSRSQSPTAALYRSTDSGKRWQRQVGPTPGATPVVKPAGWLVAGKRELVFGDAQGAGVLWERKGPGFAPPRAVLDPKRSAIAGMAASPKSWLMWGQQNDEAWTAVSADAGKTWKYSPAQTFGRVSTYSWSLIERARWVKDRWVVVGRHSVNGDARISALTYFSTDGLHWTPGVATTSKVLPDDGYGATPVLSDLAGVGSLQRSMTSVAQVGAGLMSVGWTTTDRGAQPAWWASDAKAQRWRLQPLPMKGVAQAWAADLKVTSNRVVVTGFAKAVGGSKQWGPCLWTSSNGGKSWTFSPDPGWGRSSLVSMDTYGKEVLVTVRSQDKRTVTLWRSADGGAHWKRTEVPRLAPTPGVETEVVATAVVQNTLRILTRVRTRGDAVSVVREVSLR